MTAPEHDASRRPQSRFAAAAVEKTAMQPGCSACHGGYIMGEPCGFCAGDVATRALPAHMLDDPRQPSEDTLARMARRNLEMRGFLLELVDPERFGHAVSDEVRQRAAVLLGLRK